MVEIKHFLKEPTVKNWCIKGKNITLILNEKVFPPSEQGAVLFAKNIKINKGESVIDVGTGSGILAIVAAKLGGQVRATDNDKDSIQLANENAKRNKVKIQLSLGNYFAGFKGKFDVIISNLPTEIVHPSYLKAIGPKLAKTISGGKNGNEWQLSFLDQAKKHMHKKSRLYVTTNTINDFYMQINKIVENYNSRLVDFKVVPTKEFVKDNISYYLNLAKKGKITIFKKGNMWNEFAYLWELRFKN